MTYPLGLAGVFGPQVAERMAQKVSANWGAVYLRPHCISAEGNASMMKSCGISLEIKKCVREGFSGVFSFNWHARCLFLVSYFIPNFFQDPLFSYDLCSRLHFVLDSSCFSAIRAVVLALSSNRCLAGVFRLYRCRTISVFDPAATELNFGDEYNPLLFGISRLITLLAMFILRFMK